MSDVEARILGLAITEPKYTIPVAQAHGLAWSDFQSKEHRELWKVLMEMWEHGVGIDPATVKDRAKLDGYIDQLAEVQGAADVKTYAKLIIDKALKRDQRGLGERIQGLVQEQETGAVLTEVQDELNRLSARYARMKGPQVQNPADELDASKGWSTNTGLSFLDCLLRFTSGGIHFIAGDPGSGKTTILTHILAHNARHDVNSVAILAEGDPLDIQLAMLTQTQQLSNTFASRIRFDPTFRTQDRIDEVRRLWDEHFRDLPLQIHRTEEGVDAVTSLVNAITVPSLIIIDHAYAVVSQSRMRPDGKEHQTFMRLFSAMESAAKRNDHIIILANQYTKAGRKGEERGPDAQYGGSGVQNIASSMVHIMQPRMEIAAAVGYRKMTFTVPKCRALMVVDQHGQPIDPLQETGEIPRRFYLNTKYRLATGKMPTAGGPE